MQGLGGQLQWGTPVPVELSFPKGQVTANCEESLRVLGIDVIDCLQLHTYWPTRGTRGHWIDEFQELKRRGKVRTIGVSVPDHRSDMVLPLVMSGEIDAVQTVVNIFDPTALEVLVPFCQEYGVAVLARCIFDEGGLTGFLRDDTAFPPGDFRDGYFDATVPRSAYKGLEFLYMLEGEVVYRHGDASYLVTPGDSLFFDADAPHGPEEMRRLPIRFLSVICYDRAA